MLKNKCAVITGGSDGIGLAIARAFAENGANVCLVARDKEKLLQAKTLLSGYAVAVTTIAHDLGQAAAMPLLARQILHEHGHVDILVNNAGIGRFVPFEATDEAVLDTHINLNIKTPYMLTQALLPSLVLQRGNVINISSYFSDRMLPGKATTAYSLTKGALNSFTKTLAFELGEKGVRVNAIAPGTVTTPQMRGNLERLGEAAQAEFMSMVPSLYPLGKLGEPEDIGAAAVFLASDNAKWVTGVIMPVDGGLRTS